MNNDDDENEEDAENDDDDDETSVVLIVKASNIPNGGQGLFLASPRFIAAESILLQEEVIPLSRNDAKKIRNLPTWRGLQPIIQGTTRNRCFDIRHTKIYKANHCVSTDPKCNSYVTQCGPAQIVMRATRTIWQGEEILWEYSTSMQEWFVGSS